MAVESGKFEFKLEIKANRSYTYRVLCIWLPTNTLPKYCCLWMLKDWRASSNRLTKGPANSLLSHVFHLLYDNLSLTYAMNHWMVRYSQYIPMPYMVAPSSSGGFPHHHHHPHPHYNGAYYSTTPTLCCCFDTPEAVVPNAVPVTVAQPNAVLTVQPTAYQLPQVVPYPQAAPYPTQPGPQPDPHPAQTDPYPAQPAPLIGLPPP
ncbi:hypothetical protein EMCRGX_G009414 [Ephydatia muelleri]